MQNKSTGFTLVLISSVDNDTSKGVKAPDISWWDLALPIVSVGGPLFEKVKMTKKTKIGNIFAFFIYNIKNKKVNLY